MSSRDEKLQSAITSMHHEFEIHFGKFVTSVEGLLDDESHKKLCADLSVNFKSYFLTSISDSLQAEVMKILGEESEINDDVKTMAEKQIEKISPFPDQIKEATKALDDRLENFLKVFQQKEAEVAAMSRVFFRDFISEKNEVTEKSFDNFFAEYMVFQCDTEILFAQLKSFNEIMKKIGDSIKSSKEEGDVEGDVLETPLEGDVEGDVLETPLEGDVEGDVLETPSEGDVEGDVLQRSLEGDVLERLKKMADSVESLKNHLKNF